MRQLHDDGADDRSKGFCVYWGAIDETQIVVPSKVFLDEPFPENLPQSPSCVRWMNTELAIAPSSPHYAAASCPDKY